VQLQAVPVHPAELDLPSEHTADCAHTPNVTVSAKISISRASLLLSIDRSAAPELEAGPEEAALVAARAEASGRKGSGVASQAGPDPIRDTPWRLSGTVREVRRGRVGGAVGRYCGGMRRSEIVAVETLSFAATVAVPVAMRPPKKWSHVLLPVVCTVPSFGRYLYIWNCSVKIQAII
jgi:hypothetical protein